MSVRKSSGAGNGANIRLAADIGGTFTDIAVFDDKTGRLTFGKALSTPDRLVDGISSGVEKAGSDYASASLFLHGSTVAINTMLERTGAKTALVTTEGFRDVYEIGRINRPDAYNPSSASTCRSSSARCVSRCASASPPRARCSCRWTRRASRRCAGASRRPAWKPSRSCSSTAT
jgi:hypothetical protein